MKLVIFAGGIGTRLWPLSRENSPKQFDKIFSGRSTLQLAIERVRLKFGMNNIFIQTVKNFKDDIIDQIPDFPEENIIIEPSRRNLGPAVCLAALELEKKGHQGAFAILWADHLMERPEEFASALRAGNKLINENPDRFVFLGERPRFANNNLGWINVGKQAGTKNDMAFYDFCGWKYKPSAKECDIMFKSGEWFWNPGYFITSINFLIEQYKMLAPATYDNVKSGNYDGAEANSFDRAIIEKVDLSRAVVIKTTMGWSDPGTLYALKEALAKDVQENVTDGLVTSFNTSDSLIYNFEKEKIVATVGLNGVVVINTPDALVVVSKDEVVHITDLVKKMRAEGNNKFL